MFPIIILQVYIILFHHKLSKKISIPIYSTCIMYFYWTIIKHKRITKIVIKLDESIFYLSSPV